MSDMTYDGRVERPLVWLHGEVRTPPMSVRARVRTGELLRRLQVGETLEMPQSRPMPAVGAHCHELRIPDGHCDWRVVYRADRDAVVILEVFRKQTAATPRAVIETCRERLRRYENMAKE